MTIFKITPCHNKLVNQLSFIVKNDIKCKKAPCKMNMREKSITVVDNTFQLNKNDVILFSTHTDNKLLIKVPFCKLKEMGQFELLKYINSPLLFEKKEEINKKKQ